MTPHVVVIRTTVVRRPLPVCYLCGGTMRDERAVTHELCEDRVNRGLMRLPVINEKEES